MRCSGDNNRYAKISKQLYTPRMGHGYAGHSNKRENPVIVLLNLNVHSAPLDFILPHLNRNTRISLGSLFCQPVQMVSKCWIQALKPAGLKLRGLKPPVPRCPDTSTRAICKALPE